MKCLNCGKEMFRSTFIWWEWLCDYCPAVVEERSDE